jgi:hypothetical protein
MDVRQKFEAWAKSQGYPVKRERDKETYADVRTHCGWWAYQAAHSSQQEEIERLREALSSAAERLDGYLSSPDQVALADELRAALNPTSASGAKGE